MKKNQVLHLIDDNKYSLVTGKTILHENFTNYNRLMVLSLAIFIENTYKFSLFNIGLS